MTRLHHLQSLRGVAANLVVADHLLSSLIKYGFLSSACQPLVWRIGDMGVFIFFAISGFIMVYTAGDTAGRPGAPRQFLEKRLIRIVPLYWLATLLMFALLHLSGKEAAPGDLLRSLLFLPYYSGAAPEARPLLGQGWSLNYEMLFYALFALALFFRGWRFPVVLLGLFALLLGLGAGRPALGLPDRSVLAFYGDPIILLFLAGGALGALRRRLTPTRPLRVRRPLPLALLLLAAGIGCFALAPRYWPALPGAYACGLLSVALCVFAPERQEGGLARFWEALGDGSYSTYLFHTFWLAVLNRVLLGSGAGSGLGGGEARLWAYSLAALAGANLIGLMVYRRLEKPLLRGLRALLFPVAGRNAAA